jgi:carboxyl-terminal processing protease
MLGSKKVKGFLAGAFALAAVMAVPGEALSQQPPPLSKLPFAGERLFPEVENTLTVRQQEIERLTKRFKEVLELTDEKYVTPPDLEGAVEAALKAFLQYNDPHSTFLSQKEYQQLISDNNGVYGGIGVVIQKSESGFILVSEVIEDTPAMRAGLLDGDIVTKVDGNSVEGMTPQEFADITRGQQGTEVSLTIMRAGEKAPITFELTREIIKVETSRVNHLGSGIVHLDVDSFIKNTDEQLVEDLHKLMDSGVTPSAYVLDLRNNGGGLLDTSMEIANLFLPGDMHILKIDARGEENDISFFSGPYQLIDMQETPVIILVNENSASASEIVAGTLQHYGATVMGSQSFGKGSVQTVERLSDGSGAKFTIALYYTANGRTPQHDGVTPNILVETNNKSDTGSQHERDLEKTLSPPNQEPDPVEPCSVCRISESLGPETLPEVFKSNKKTADIELLCAFGEALRRTGQDYSQTRVVFAPVQDQDNAPDTASGFMIPSLTPGS